MLLHVGAGLHGHDYSAQPQSPTSPTRKPPPRPYPFLRSALRPLTDIIEPVNPEPSGGRRRSLSDPLPPSSLRHRTLSDIPHKKDLSVRFEEPLMELASPSTSAFPSDDEESLAGSDVSFGFGNGSGSGGTPLSGKRRRRARRQSSRFALAYPPPALRNKQRMLVQIRPRLLLQLQRLSDQRPIPAFDIVPSTIISGTYIIPKLTRRFPRIFRAKPQLGQDDLLVVRSEDYNAPLDNDNEQDSRLDNRDLIAVISPLEAYGEDSYEIVMEDGSIWTTSIRPNGSYEFKKVDTQGTSTTARWVKKEARRKITRATQTQTDSDTSPMPTPPPTEYKWTFSIIDPSTKRHPVLGVATRSELEVYDTYSTMSSSSGRFPPTKPFAIEGQSSRPTTPIREDRSTEPVTEDFKTLMIVTASWLSLRQEGWPANVNPKMRRSLPSTRSPDMERRRTFPMSDNILMFSPSASPAQCLPCHAPPIQRSKTPPVLKRSISSGAAFMQKHRLSAAAAVDSSVHSRLDVRDATDHALPSQKGPKKLSSEEETHTCRIKMRRLTQRLFNRKNSRSDKSPAA